MIRGTTPTHVFTIPIDVSMIKNVKIVYSQFDKIVLEKTGDDVELSGNTLTTRLSQEDTFGFACTGSVHIQLRILTDGGSVLASKIMTVTVGRCLDSEVLT